MLRLCWAAKFRDIAENASDKKWIQGLVFVPLLFLTLDVLKLPVHLLWHSLSLHYQQSVQAGARGAGIGARGNFSISRWNCSGPDPLRSNATKSAALWLYFWFPAVLILFGLMVISPLVIDPLFNKFEPLNNEHPDLVASIESSRNMRVCPFHPSAFS